MKQIDLEFKPIKSFLPTFSKANIWHGRKDVMVILRDKCDTTSCHFLGWDIYLIHDDETNEMIDAMVWLSELNRFTSIEDFTEFSVLVFSNDSRKISIPVVLEKTPDFPGPQNVQNN